MNRIYKVTVMVMNMDMIKKMAEVSLGASYSKSQCVFRLWSPAARNVDLVLYENAGSYNDSGLVLNHEDGLHIPMRHEGGEIWTAEVNGNLAGKYYMFKIKYQNGDSRYIVDPYARAVSANGCRGAVVDPEACHPQGWLEDQRPPLSHISDAVVYELHVRDFSISPDSGMKYKGKFKAFTETGLKDEFGHCLGIDHLEELGVTHVHLLPIFDFKTVNELKSSSSFDPGGEYNWGYDPQNYNVPEGSYATDPSKPEIRIRECKEMIQALHRKGIRVIMDVVFNHTYTVEDGPFEAAAPGYFYRTNEYGLSNGSGVGNELATERPMVRKFIKDSLRYWAEEYHIDGFRFDLMALMDTQTMQEIAEELQREVDPGILIYGEPWTGGDSPLHDKTVKGTQRGKGFSVFNDHYRQAVKGDNDGAGRGFATGEGWCEGGVAEGMLGSIHDFAQDPSETINYVTVHDNLNLWDKVLTAGGMAGRAGHEGWLPATHISGCEALSFEPVRRSLIANGLMLLSQGIPLLHAGDELLRTKFGDHNSYRSGDHINAIRWVQKALYYPVFQYYKGLISLRRKHPGFRLRTREQVERHMEIIRCGEQTAAYRLSKHTGWDHVGQTVVIVNASLEPKRVDLPPSYYCWNVVVNDKAAGTETLDTVENSFVDVPPLSIMVLLENTNLPKQRLVRIEVEYERDDDAYEGWNAWVWGTGIHDGEIPFKRMQDGRMAAVFYAAADVEQVGCIVRLNDWEAREWDQDQYIPVPPGQEQLRLKVTSGEKGRGLQSVYPDLAC